MGDWPRERIKCEGFERSILKSSIIYIYTQEQITIHGVALVIFGEEATSEESLLEELRLR